MLRSVQSRRPHSNDTFEFSQGAKSQIFQYIEFEDFSWSAEFWRDCGPRIESLSFEECMLTKETLKHVQQHCNRLISISFKYLRGNPVSGVDEIIPNFEEAAAATVVGTVRSLKSSVSSVGQIPDGFFSTICNIYPNLTEFSFGSEDYFFDIFLNLTEFSFRSEDNFFAGLDEEERWIIIEFGEVLKRRLNEIESIVMKDPEVLLLPISKICILPFSFPKFVCEYEGTVDGRE